MFTKITIPFLVLTLSLVSCVEMKNQAMFDAPADQEIPEGIKNFYALNVFEGKLNGEHWFSVPPEIESKECLDITSTYFITSELDENGEAIVEPAMRWTWDKQAGDCDWMGMGLGWDGWSGKDLSQITDKAAIQLKVRSVKGDLKSLPLAACLEDYGDNQVWIGFHPQVIENGIIKEDEWSNVTLPLAEFEWDIAQDIDMSNIKQMLVQFEAAGDLYVKEINVIPFKGGFTKRIEIPYANQLDLTIDGKTDETLWSQAQAIEFASYEVKSLSDDENFYFSLSFDSEQNIINPFTDGGMWNGDGFEIAFTSNHELGKKRVFMSSTDQHFIINLANKRAWDFRNSSLIEGIQVAESKNNETYQFEIKVPLSSLDLDAFTPNVKYQIEFAVGKSSADGTKREMQYKWNSEGKDGFYAKPALWGEMKLNPLN
ncbi:hypothetical protein N9V23_01815 [Flavobacteriales bacterium]|nr:hypothetical protein [Flavobacteriales bacterium]